MLGPAGITAVLFSFSKPLNPSRVPDLGNYGYYVDVAGANGAFRTSGDSYIPLSAVQYNPATSTVAVIPSTPLPLNCIYFWSFAFFPSARRTGSQIALLAIETPGATRGHRGKWIMS